MTSINNPNSEGTGENMERDRWRLIITIGVAATVVIGLVGIGIGVASLGKTTTTTTTPGPAVAVVEPTTGNTVSGTAAFDVVALTPNVVGVYLLATGGSLHDTQVASSKLSISGWGSMWDTTKVSNGTYRIAAMAYNSLGASSRSSSVNVTVKN